MHGFRLGSVLGFEIRIDYSWFVIAFLILWSFSAGVFPARYPGLEPGVYLMMGTIGAVLFFASLVAHELSHSVVARRRGIEVLERMTKSGTDRVVVSEFGRHLGVISASDVTRRVLKAQGLRRVEPPLKSMAAASNWDEPVQFMRVRPSRREVRSELLAPRSGMAICPCGEFHRTARGSSPDELQA